MRDGIEVETVHHHPENMMCECFKDLMTEIGSIMVRKEVEFIPVRMKKVQHIEHGINVKIVKAIHLKKSQIK